MAHELLVRITGTIEAVSAATEQVSAWLESIDAGPHWSYLAALTIEEIAVNCIHYGYHDSLQHEILVHLSIVDDLFTLIMSDDAEAYNSLEAPPPDLGRNIEDRRIGGLGIHLLRQMWDQITYARIDDRNRLVFEKHRGEFNK